MVSLIRAVCLALSLAAAGPGAAQERVLPPDRAAGFDTVVMQCVSFVRIRFANAMCERLSASIPDLATRNGLTLMDLGQTEWGFGSDRFLTPPEGTDLSSAVHLTFYIRATDTPPSAYLWASLYVPQTANSGRTGRLVLWEDSGIDSGDPQVVTRGLTDGLAAKLTPVFEALGEGRPD